MSRTKRRLLVALLLAVALLANGCLKSKASKTGQAGGNAKRPVSHGGNAPLSRMPPLL